MRNEPNINSDDYYYYIEDEDGEFAWFFDDEAYLQDQQEYEDELRYYAADYPEEHDGTI